MPRAPIVEQQLTRLRGARDDLGHELRAGARWLGEHALVRAVFSRAAANGEVFARLERDPELRADPYPAYEVIRARGRLVRGSLVWASTDHALATALLRHPDAGVTVGVPDLPRPMRALIRWGEDPWAVGPVDPPSLLAVNPPDHTRLRRLVNRAFTARQVQAQEEVVAETATGLLDAIEGEGSRVDLVEAYSSQLPVSVIGSILGVPPAENQQLLEWGNSAALLLDPGLSIGRFRQGNSAMRALHEWVDGHIERKRREPSDDLLSRLAGLEGDDVLSDVELRMVALLVLAAGFETTVNLISNAVALLDAHPHQRDLALAEPERWAGVVEETLRFESPVQNVIRTAPRALQIDGVDIPAGATVLLYLGAANRDPNVFDDPHTFDITRANAADHLAFSSGIHYCLGASLARAEARIALRMLFERFPGLTIDGEAVRRSTLVLRGYDRLPVRTH